MKKIYPESMPTPKGYYSPAIVHNNTVYVSGQLALNEKGEPQIIRRNDTDVAVVVSIEEWRRMKGKRASLVEILRTSPLVGEELDLSRPNDYPRGFDFGE